MLFEMYETYTEKASPDTYNGLPILNRDDLVNAIKEAAGDELASLVVKYLERVERQASDYVEDMEREKRAMEKDLEKWYKLAHKSQKV